MVLYDSIKQNCFAYGLPHSIAVLINFGYKDKHIMYSAENWIHDCDEDELWDPFSEVFPISYYLIFQINYYLIDLLGQLSMWI